MKEQKQKRKASDFFHKAVDVQVGESEYLYYRALSQMELGLEDEAAETSARLLKAGKKALESSGEEDFFAKFGAKRTQSKRQASAYYLMGLAASSSGDQKEANVSLQKALELSNSILWAYVLMEEK